MSERDVMDHRLRTIADAVGATLRMHAIDLDSGRQVAVDGDAPVVIASIVKVLIVLEHARQVARGQIDPTERVLVRPSDRLGGWGLAGCQDDVEVSFRDLAHFAMTVSDNTAADLLIRRVGLDAVRLLADELGLHDTVLRGGPREVVETMTRDVDADDDAAFSAALQRMSSAEVRTLSAFDPARTTSSTPRDITRMLQRIWDDEAGPPQACRTVRDLMAAQLFWTRMRSGFPPEVHVAAKTGTLPGLHMEAGVVSHPDGRRFAVAVFLDAGDLVAVRPRMDAAIGRIARTAVDALR